MVWEEPPSIPLALSGGGSLVSASTTIFVGSIVPTATASPLLPRPRREMRKASAPLAATSSRIVRVVGGRVLKMLLTDSMR